MSRRARTLGYGTAAAVIVGGITSAAVITAAAGALVAVALVGLGPDRAGQSGLPRGRAQ